MGHGNAVIVLKKMLCKFGPVYNIRAQNIRLRHNGLDIRAQGHKGARS